MIACSPRTKFDLRCPDGCSGGTNFNLRCLPVDLRRMNFVQIRPIFGGGRHFFNQWSIAVYRPLYIFYLRWYPGNLRLIFLYLHCLNFVPRRQRFSRGRDIKIPAGTGQPVAIGFFADCRKRLRLTSAESYQFFGPFLWS